MADGVDDDDGGGDGTSFSLYNRLHSALIWVYYLVNLKEIA